MVPLGQVSKTVCLRHPALQHKSPVPEDDELDEDEVVGEIQVKRLSMQSTKLPVTMQHEGEEVFGKHVGE